jgi:hypothetical protein
VPKRIGDKPNSIVNQSIGEADADLGKFRFLGATGKTHRRAASKKVVQTFESRGVMVQPSRSGPGYIDEMAVAAGCVDVEESACQTGKSFVFRRAP